MIKDLTQWKITKTIILFALPMLIGNLVQQIYNIADTIIVWKYISDSALASVWAAFPTFFLLISILIWLSIWASVIISHLFGAKNLKAVKTASYTALISSIILWIIISIAWYFTSWPILNLLKTPADIFEWAELYLHIIFIWATILFVYNMATAIFNALWDSKTPLVFNIVSAIVNILLDLLFILKFHRWISGAARATVISRAIAMLLSLAILFKRLTNIQTEKLENYFSRELLKRMWTIAIPSMLNQTLVAIGWMAIQSVINWFGSDIIAWYTASSKIDSLAMLPIINLSNALATFVAQNLWAWKLDRVKAGYKSSLTISICFWIFMAIIIYFCWTNIMKLFLNEEANPAIIEFWNNYMMIVSFGYILMWFLFNSWAVLRAAGAMKPFLMGTLLSTIIRVAAAFLLAKVMWESVIRRCVIIWRWVWATISTCAYLFWSREKQEIIKKA